MNNIILQPTGNKDARKHYFDTIQNPVDINVIKKFVDVSLFNKISAIYPNGKVYIWGVTNGKNNVNEKRWAKIKSGDVTLFSQDGKIFRSGVTTITFKNKDLAKHLWDVNSDGETWENIYLVDELKDLNISYVDFNSIVGYDEKFIIQGFSYLDDEKSNLIIESLALDSDTYGINIDKSEYEKEISKLLSSKCLDTVTSGTSRKEQSYLRKKLFHGIKTCKCGICNRELPIDMLITAHIKKRSECTFEERLDVDNIVMPMCKLGCDDLYEKGYLFVDEMGKVAINKNRMATPTLKSLLASLDGTLCSHWNTKTKKYFEYHRESL